MIVDSLNQLSSFYGQYSPATKLAIFNDSVRLENPNFTLYSDTLHYNTESKISTILGPSVIVSDSGTIHSSKGWYDTVHNTSMLLDRSEIVSGNRFLTGDSIAYDREQGFGEVFGNMCIRDTLQKIMATTTRRLALLLLPIVPVAWNIHKATHSIYMRILCKWLQLIQLIAK